MNATKRGDDVNSDAKSISRAGDDATDDRVVGRWYWVRLHGDGEWFPAMWDESRRFMNNDCWEDFDNEVWEWTEVLPPPGWREPTPLTAHAPPRDPTPEMIRAVDGCGGDKYLTRGRAVDFWTRMYDRWLESVRSPFNACMHRQDCMDAIARERKRGDDLWQECENLRLVLRNLAIRRPTHDEPGLFSCRACEWRWTKTYGETHASGCPVALTSKAGDSEQRSSTVAGSDAGNADALKPKP